METIIVTKLNPAQNSPTYNPFKVVSLEDYKFDNSIAEIKTGLKIDLPDEYYFIAKPLKKGLRLLGVTLIESELVILAVMSEFPYVLFIGEEIAQVEIIVKNSAKVRFVEKTPEGHRMITGEGQNINGQDS